jgi:hypothetical protein
MKLKEFLHEDFIHVNKKDISVILNEQNDGFTKEIYKVFKNVLKTLHAFNITLSKNQQEELVHSIARDL